MEKASTWLSLLIRACPMPREYDRRNSLRAIATWRWPHSVTCVDRPGLYCSPAVGAERGEVPPGQSSVVLDYEHEPTIRGDRHVAHLGARAREPMLQVAHSQVV